jgi:hypothetical protein
MKEEKPKQVKYRTWDGDKLSFLSRSKVKGASKGSKELNTSSDVSNSVGSDKVKEAEIDYVNNREMKSTRKQSSFHSLPLHSERSSETSKTIEKLFKKWNRQFYQNIINGQLINSSVDLRVIRFDIKQFLVEKIAEFEKKIIKLSEYHRVEAQKHPKGDILRIIHLNIFDTYKKVLMEVYKFKKELLGEKN